MLKGAKTLEEVLATLKNAGYDVTEEDLKGAKMIALTDGDLDKVAGGWGIRP